MTATASDVQFGYELLVTTNFDDVLARIGEPCPLDSLVALMRHKGRLLLQARGGAGKTRTAERLADLVPHASGVALVSARNLPVELGKAAGELDMDMLVSVCADPERAKPLEERGEGLVIIDGINEITKDRAGEILMAIPGMAARYPFVSFLVTDRLTRRDIDQNEWVLATLGPVPPEEAGERLGIQISELPDHMTIPYYLDQSLRHHEGAAETQVEILRRGITVHGGVPASDLESLARAVYVGYEDRCERSVDLDELRRAVGDKVLSQMRASGLLVGEDDEIQFFHHLNQDFLAALHLSANESLWKSTGFDALSLRTSSFDALALAAALIERRQSVDDFVHRVFDWNYYGAAYILEEDQAGEKRIWEAMRTAILAMLAEKRFDRMVMTAHRVEDALRLQGVELASLLLKAKDRDAVVEVVEASLPTGWDTTWPEWFQHWYETFKRPSGSTATGEDIADLRSEVGTIGWASSNMLKRLNISEDLRQAVSALAEGDPDPTVRWRAVHTLGAWPTDSVVEVLLDQVRDPAQHLWVRYGALRSLLETAAAGSVEIRSRVFGALGSGEIAVMIAADSNLRKEAVRALEVSEMPADWHAQAGDFMEHLWAESDDPLDRDQVVLLAQRLRNSRAVRA